MAERIKSLTPDLKCKTQRDQVQAHRSHESKIPELPNIYKQLEVKTETNARSSSTLHTGKSYFSFSSRLHERQAIVGSKMIQRIKRLKPIDPKPAQNTINILNKGIASPVKAGEIDQQEDKNIKIYELIHSFGGFSIKINTAIVEYFSTSKRTLIPLNDLPYVLYEKSETKIAEKIKKYTDENEEWLNNAYGLSLIYMSLPLDYPHSIYRYKFERILILLTPTATRNNKRDEISIKFFSKGLLLKDYKNITLTDQMMEKLFLEKMSDMENKVVEAMCWEGFEASKVLRNICEINESINESLLKPEEVMPRVKVVFTAEEIKGWDFPHQKQSIAFGSLFNLYFPLIKISLADFNQEISIPLGLLKRILQDNMVNWVPILMNYFYSRNSLYKVGNQSTWISFIKYREDDTILIFKGPQLLLESNGVYIKHNFSIREIPILLDISANHRSKFLKFIISQSTIERGLNNEWNINIDISNYKPTGKLSVLKSLDEELEVLNLRIRVQFKLPQVELYMLNTKTKDSRIVKNEICQGFAINNFRNWDQELLFLFNQ
ncbi:unnamed protein product [Blepharisma stoltei]|uniref:Uncharacterized protein n=1 Tax=Blepharisma stoltei TaxID=1481888 RepID=A0AAU9K4G2_9CILI|nr:unnamed protein product [Blepharisma stoltei]